VLLVPILELVEECDKGVGPADDPVMRGGEVDKLAGTLDPALLFPVPRWEEA
jgi:hypothetical protein